MVDFRFGCHCVCNLLCNRSSQVMTGYLLTGSLVGPGGLSSVSEIVQVDFRFGSCHCVCILRWYRFCICWAAGYDWILARRVSSWTRKVLKWYNSWIIKRYLLFSLEPPEASTFQKKKKTNSYNPTNYISAIVINIPYRWNVRTQLSINKLNNMRMEDICYK